MRKLSVLALIVFRSAVLVSAQQEPQITSASFTPEQTAVYQTFLTEYPRGRQSLLNVVETTDFLQPDDGTTAAV
jgi:hypothetical protein